MADLIEKYSPNIRWGKQHVEVVLMQWAYSATFNVDVGGTCSGFSVLENAAERVYAKLPLQHGVSLLVLTDAKGETLECEDEDIREEEWVKDMIVSVRITGWTAPTLNEIREKNGADPVADGEQPWDPR